MRANEFRERDREASGTISGASVASTCLLRDRSHLGYVFCSFFGHNPSKSLFTGKKCVFLFSSFFCSDGSPASQPSIEVIEMGRVSAKHGQVLMKMSVDALA